MTSSAVAQSRSPCVFNTLMHTTCPCKGQHGELVVNAAAAQVRYLNVRIPAIPAVAHHLFPSGLERVSSGSFPLTLTLPVHTAAISSKQWVMPVAAAVAEEGEEGELPVDTAAAHGKAAASEVAAGAAEAPKLWFKLRARMEAFLFEVQVSFISCSILSLLAFQVCSGS